jgi:hypothetical protein
MARSGGQIKYRRPRRVRYPGENNPQQGEKSNPKTKAWTPIGWDKSRILDPDGDVVLVLKGYEYTRAASVNPDRVGGLSKYSK